MEMCRLLWLLCGFAVACAGDVNEYFNGMSSRPHLLITSPHDGVVLGDSTIHVQLQLEGYSLPSHFRDSSICVGLASDGEQVAETCFSQSSALEYTIEGLSPGSSYVLAAVLLERGNAIAVSVRSFRVGGVAIPEHLHSVQRSTSAQLTLQDALHMAVTQQAQGKHTQAETLYEGILQEDPEHSDALHLLGLVHYQQGDSIKAIEFITKAIEQNGTHEGYYNSLGECFRALGQTMNAIGAYKKALQLNPGYTAARFNLGLAFHQHRDWGRAIATFQKVLSDDEVNEALQWEARVYLCDLMETLELLEEAIECWEVGVRMYPDNGLMHNELGKLQLQAGDIFAASIAFATAAEVGFEPAQLNLAVVHELEDRYDDSIHSLQLALATAEHQGLPCYHIRIKAATVLPRIIPSEVKLAHARKAFEIKLDALLAEPPPYVDNSPPSDIGYSLGYHLAFHGSSNLEMKQRLSSLYRSFCPALSRGTFLDLSTIMGDHSYQLELFQSSQHRSLVSAARAHQQDEAIPADPAPKQESEVIRVGIVSRLFVSMHPVSTFAQGLLSKLDHSKFHVVVVAISDNRQSQQGIFYGADVVHYLDPNLNLVAKTLRREQLDAIIFPEVGSEPVVYFLAHARLAPVQIAWLGHPDTSGISTVDYFATTQFEVENAELHYSERLVKMSGLGAFFPRIDTSGLADTEALRSSVREELHLPDTAKFYICAQALYKFHPIFDDALLEILELDQAAHLLILDDLDRTVWQTHLVQRLQRRMIGNVKSRTHDIVQRILFYTVSGEHELLSLLKASHVVLEPFPAGGFYPSLMALAIGVPVVTFPSELLAGRTTYALYRMMGIGSQKDDSSGHCAPTFASATSHSSLNVTIDPECCCVVFSASHYVQVATAIANDDKLRESVTTFIKERHDKLFEQQSAIRDWTQLLTTAVRENAPAPANNVEKRRAYNLSTLSE